MRSNVVWNWAGIATTMLVGVIVMPFLIRQLGKNGYGLWILISSFTGYFGLLDLGVRGAVGRNVAFHRAQGNYPALNATLSTAFALLCGTGFLALLGTLAVIPLFPTIFEIPPEQLAEVQWALFLVGVNLTLWLPLTVFDGTLWGYQRFDVLNIIDISAAILRGVLTFLLLDGPHGLVFLAILNLVTLSGAQGVKAIVAFRLDRRLRLRTGDIQRAMVRTLYGWGAWYFLIAFSRLITNQLSSFLVGVFLSVGMVAVYSIANRLIGYCNSFMVAAAGVLTPAATELHAQERREEQRAMLVRGGRLCAALASAFLVGFFFLGDPLIHLWLGEGMRGAVPLLLILAVGEMLPQCQLANHSMILAMGKHKVPALLGVAESLVVIALGGLVAPRYGLPGVCVVFAVTGSCCRGVVPLVYGCKLTGIPLHRYMTHAFLPGILATGPGALLLAGLLTWKVPTNWVALLGYIAGFGLLFLGAVAVINAPARLRWRGGAFSSLGKFFCRRERARPALPETTPCLKRIADEPAVALEGE